MIKQVIIIANDIMIVGKQQNHRDHNIVLTTLIETARKCNVRLNFDKLQYKKTEVDFFDETYTSSGCKPAQSKVKSLLLQRYQLQHVRSKSNHSLEWSIICQNSQQDCQSLHGQLGTFLRLKYHSTGAFNTKKPSSK